MIIKKDRTYKIGEVVELKQDITMSTLISSKSIELKAGDKGYINSNKTLTMFTGAGKYKRIHDSKIQLKGYAHDSMASMVYNRLEEIYGIARHLGLDEEEITEFIDQIADVLSDIL